jgi:NtrC-family two-component system response regulator AlgB
VRSSDEWLRALPPETADAAGVSRVPPEQPSSALRGSAGAFDATALLECKSTAMREVIRTARRVSQSDVNVLLTGESGTGKHLLARAIHDWSPRSAAPFAVFSPATRRALLRPRAGTLFLDEVAAFPAALQADLARLLVEDRSRGDLLVKPRFDARVVAATNRDLEGEVRAGRFREDLFFCLSVVTIRLPALRERVGDLLALAEGLLARMATRHGRGHMRLAPAARRALREHVWPGNVRELANALEHAVVLSQGDTITVEHLPSRVVSPSTDAGPGVLRPANSLHELEMQHITRVLAASATLDEAATRLGIDPSTLWRKRKRWGLD